MMMMSKMKKVMDPHIPHPTKKMIMMPLIERKKDRNKMIMKSDCYFQMFPPPHSDKLLSLYCFPLHITKHSLM